MNHEDGTDPWFFGRPQAPPWDAIEYNQLISAGPLLPLLEQYATIGTMRDQKVTVDMFVDLEMAFYLCTTMTLFTGSYDTTTQAGIPWQVATQGAIGDRYAGDQLQVANVANQGNAKKWHVDVAKKTCKDGKTYEYFEKTQDHHAARGNRWQPDTCHQRLTQVRRMK
jgi:hypothetical protein